MAAIFLASPFVLGQVWLFISPGLYKHERKYALPFIFSSSLLFVLGGLFGYFVAFPFALQFQRPPIVSFELKMQLLMKLEQTIPLGKAVHTDTDASAVGDDAGTARACFSTASVSRPSTDAAAGS